MYLKNKKSLPDNFYKVKTSTFFLIKHIVLHASFQLAFKKSKTFIRSGKFFS